jgi:hypothetical protein
MPSRRGRRSASSRGSGRASRSGGGARGPSTIIGALLPQSWQDHVLIYLPGAASDAIAFGHLPDAPHGLSPVVAAIVLLGWTALFLGGAWAALERRDA